MEMMGRLPNLRELDMIKADHIPRKRRHFRHVAGGGCSGRVLARLGFQFAQQMGWRLMKLAAVLGGRFVPCRTAFESSYSRTIFTIGQAGGDDALTPNREEGRERKTRGKMEMGDG